MANGIGRDLLITLALTTQGLEQAEQLEKELRELKAAGSEDIQKTIRLQTEGVEQVESRLRELGLSSQQVDDITGDLRKNLRQVGEAAGSNQLDLFAQDTSKLSGATKESAQASQQAAASFDKEAAAAAKTKQRVDDLARSKKKLEDEATRRGGRGLPEDRSIRDLLFGGGFSGLVKRSLFSTVRLGLYAQAAAIIFGVASAIRAAFENARDFEKALADIQGVLPSKSEMEALNIGAIVIENAREYGIALSDAAGAAQIFAQTGQGATEIARSLNAALLAVRGANLELEQAQQLIIAIQQVSQGEVQAIEILDRISRVEARRAVTSEDLAVALQRIGPLVRVLRGDMRGLLDEFDIAIGAVTTIVERTRVAGDRAATSLKFVLSRLGRPQILRNVQQLAGIELGRPGGEELRPFVEILQELSIAFRELREEGKSAQAFELLTQIGGARQLQATAALLEDFGQTMETARISSLAFGDATQRTAIALDTIDAKLSQVGVAWSNFADAVINSTAVSGILKFSLDALSGTLDFLSDAARTVDSVISQTFLHGRSRFAVDFVDVSDINVSEIPRLQRLNTIAQEANTTLDGLIRRITDISEEISRDLIAETGLSLPGLLERLESVRTDEFRDLHEEIGTRLANALRSTVPEIDQLSEAMAETDDPARQAELNAQRLSIAYEILGNTVFATNAIIATNTQKLQDSLASVIDLIQSDLLDLTQSVEVSASLGDVFERRLGPSLEQVRGSFLGILDQNLPDEFFHVARGLINVTGATDAWRDAVIAASREARELGESSFTVGRALDFFARDLFADTRNFDEAVESLTARLASVLQARDLPGQGELRFDRPGEVFLNEFNRLLVAVADNLRETTAETSEQADLLRTLEAIGNASQARRAELLDTLDEKLSIVNRRLLETLVTFGKATVDSNNLADAYERIGVAIDRQQNAFDNAQQAFEGISTLQTTLQKELVLSKGNIDEIGSSIEDLLVNEEGFEHLRDEAQGYAAVTEALNALTGENSQTAQQARQEYQLLQEELARLDTRSLQNIFPDTEQGQFFAEVLNQALEGTDLTIGEILVNLEALKRAFEILLDTAQEQLIQRQLDLQLIEHQNQLLQDQIDHEQELVRLRTRGAVRQARAIARLESALAAQTFTPVDDLRASIRLNQILFREEEKRIRETNRLQARSIEEEFAKRIEDIESRRPRIGDDADVEIAAAREEREERILKLRQQQREELIDAAQSLGLSNLESAIGALVDANTRLNDQIQANVDASVAGFQTLLTDVQELRHGAVRTLLTPIADTFISRTAENFTSSLFDATTGPLADITRKIGEAPEQRFRTQLAQIQEQLGIAGVEISQRFLQAGHQVAAEIAAAVRGHTGPGQTLPEVPSGGLEDSARKAARETEKLAENAEDAANNTGSFGDQLGVLGGNILGTFAGGGGENAQLGSGIGTLLGSLTPFGPLGSIAGGLIGGLFGGIFDDDEDDKVRQTLDKIEQNTRRSVEIMELERQAAQIARGAVNIPTAFSIPRFTPSFGGTGVSQSNRFEISVSVSGGDSDQVVQAITTELGPELTKALKRIGV